MNNYGEWKESKKEYKRMKRQERNKRQAKFLLIVFLCLIPLSIVMVVNKQLNPTATDQVSADAEFDPSQHDMRPLLESYDSKVPFKVIFRVDSSRFYYIQQTKGEVTAESADEILKELYAKEAWAENGGTLGNVLIYDSSVKLTPGVKPNMMELEEKAEYLSRESVILIGDIKTEFDAARKE